MKKMFNKKFFLILGSAITLLIVLSVAMIFLTKENIKTFSKEGYIIASGNENTEKYYFDKGTSYKQNISSQLVFTDTSGEKVTVDKNNFMHYTDGGLKFLQNGVIMDLNSINNTTVPYYNITDKSVLEYSKKSYYIETIDKTLAFNNIAGRISENKYIFAGVNIKLQLAGNEKLIEGDYFEVNFIEDGIVRIENQEVSYQTTAENSSILVDDMIRIDLGSKKIYYNGEEKLSLQQMTIDGNENIEIIPEEEEGTGSGEGDGNGNGTGEGTNNGEEEQPGTDDPGTDEPSTDEPGTDEPGTDEPGTDEPGTDGSGGNGGSGGTGSLRSATIEMTKGSVTANSISAQFVINDPDKAIKGDLVLRVVNTDTGKQEYELVIDKTQPEFMMGVSTLSPDSNYLLSINEENNGKNNTQYFQKLFRTDSLGIKLEKKYATENSLAYEVIFDKETNVKSAKVSLYEVKNISETEQEKIQIGIADVDKINTIAFFENLKSNTQYSIVLDNVVMDTFEFNQVYSIYKSTKTLKKSPYLDGLSTEVDDETNNFSVGIKRVVDEDKSITKYSYHIFKADDITEENIDTIEPVQIIEKYDTGKVTVKIDNKKILPKTNYKFKIVAEYYDNEKYGEFETELSDNFILTGKPKIEFIKDEEKSTFNKIVGVIKLTDDSCTVPMYGRGCSNPLWHENQFQLDYKVINSSAPTVTIKPKFDLSTFEAQIEIDNLLANTEYVFNLFGDVNLLDGKGLREGYHIGSFRTSTNSIDILTVDWKQNDVTKEDLINVSARIASSGTNKNLGESIYHMTVNLYTGDVQNELKAGATIEPVKTKQFSGEETKAFYDNYSTINTLNTFGITDQKKEIVNEETGEITYETIKAIDVLKALSNDDKLLDYYTIEITELWDEEYNNKLKIENNYYRFNTPASFRIEYELDPPTISADPITNSQLQQDKDLADKLKVPEIGILPSRQLAETTIMGYKVDAVASLSRMFNYLPIKELIYYVCDTDLDPKCTIENAVETRTIDVKQTTDLTAYFKVANGTRFVSPDQTLARGHNYIFKLKFSYDIIDKDGNVAGTGYYPSYEVESLNKHTPKEAPSYKNYVLSTSEDKITYIYEYFDMDNALYENEIYYTVDDELKNQINKEEEIPEEENGEEEIETLDEEETPDEPPTPTEPEIKKVKLENCKKITNPQTYAVGWACQYDIESLSKDSVYKIDFKQALIKRPGSVETKTIGNYIFDGQYKYDENTVRYYNSTSENDNRLRIIIDKENKSEFYVNRISAYEVKLSVDGLEDYKRVYPSDKIDKCIDGENEYKCIIVDYADIKEFKTKDITVSVKAYYDSGVVDNVFLTSNGDIYESLTNEYGYILQNNNKFNDKFARGNYIYIRDNGSVSTSSCPVGIYKFTKALNSSIKIARQLDINSFAFAEKPIEYTLVLTGLNDGYHTKDSGGVNQSINNKLLSKTDLGTDKNTFKFNSIIPKITVTTKGLVNGSTITIKPHGLDEEILEKEFKKEDGKYYFYLDIYKDKEAEEPYQKNIKLEIDYKKGSVIELTKYMPDTTYYFKVSAYLLKEKDYKKTQLFDSIDISSYTAKTYSFSTLPPNSIISLGKPTAAYESKSGTNNQYLLRELNLIMKTSNIGTYNTRFELEDINGKNVLTKTVEPIYQSSQGYYQSTVTEDITPTQDKIKNGKDIVFGPGFYKMKVYVETEVEVTEETPDGKAELLVYESDITLKKLEDPVYSITKTETTNSLTFKVTVRDKDRVIKDGKYCVVLLNSAQKPIAGINPTCGNSASETSIKFEYKGLTSDTLYNFRVYSDVYTNNVDDNIKNREVITDMVVSTSTSYGVALGSVAAYASKTSVTLSFGSGVNITNIKKIDYTLMEMKPDGSGGTEIKSESYIMGVDNFFSVDGNTVELKIAPEGLQLTTGNSYYIVMTFWVSQNGQLVQLNNKNYEYTIKFK